MKKGTLIQSNKPVASFYGAEWPWMLAHDGRARVDCAEISQAGILTGRVYAVWEGTGQGVAFSPGDFEVIPE